MDSMFMELFEHIDRHGIAMTAPVEMGYASARSDAAMSSMAFPYRTRALGEVGGEGPVRVRDVEARTFASVGVRGDYARGTYERGLDVLAAWLADHDATWRSAGPPRYLAYNGPFVPTFMRYGEVQVPVEPRPAPSPRPPREAGRRAR